MNHWSGVKRLPRYLPGGQTWYFDPQILWKEIFCGIQTGELIRSRVIKIVATSCHILRLKCTKFHFSWGSADPAGGAYSAPTKPLAEFKAPPQNVPLIVLTPQCPRQEVPACLSLPRYRCTGCSYALVYTCNRGQTRAMGWDHTVLPATQHK